MEITKQGNFVTVETEYGPVRGVEKLTVIGLEYQSFQAIPYMKAPLGKLRFVDAQPPEKWTEPFDATGTAPSYFNFDMHTHIFEGQEDAGVINVYTFMTYGRPEKLMPTLVYIHGGGFKSGSGEPGLFGPDYFMESGEVVLVTFNYRLGVIGFLSLKDPTLNIPGNAGLKDQNFALKWVQKNIAGFGGDPQNVTLFGESVSRLIPQ